MLTIQDLLKGRISGEQLSSVLALIGICVAVMIGWDHVRNHLALPESRFWMFFTLTVLGYGGFYLIARVSKPTIL